MSAPDMTVASTLRVIPCRDPAGSRWCTHEGVERVFMGGAADVESLYKLAYESGIDLLSPPKKNAKKRDEAWMQD